MCGIAAIFGIHAEQSKIEAMLLNQHHRGPDHTGVSIHKSKIALGHNRLSIIDLSSEANQPMVDNSGRYTIVFNGEIYNYLELKQKLKQQYTFKTKSDTEVLLAGFSLHGKKFLNQLNGMFAFVIYDQHKGELFAARDRFGVKPVYYIQHNKSLYIASEIGAFKAAGIDLQVNESVWADYLCNASYGLPSESFWQDIKQLEAGCYLEFANKLKITRWYDFVSRVENIKSENSSLQIQTEYQKLLEESISLRFRADVEVGFNLSGGIDSSLLLALVNKQYPDHDKIKAYTFYTGDERYDELFWVEKMLEQTCNPLEKVKLLAEDVPMLASEMTAIQYEPFGGIPTIAYYNLFRQARQNNTLVLLDGQGMDEQWAGYDYYMNKGDNLVQGMKGKATREDVLNAEFKAISRKSVYPKPFNNKLQNMQYRDLFYTKIPRALRFNDRASMACSVELREPFLDYRLVEMAFAQPPEYKIKATTGKWMLRKIAQNIIKDKIALAPKRPLQTPQREWLGKELSGFVQAQINQILDSPFSSWFDSQSLQKMWSEYLAGDKANGFYIWQWVSVGLMIEMSSKQ